MSISPEQEELKKKAMEYQKQQEAAAAEEKVCLCVNRLDCGHFIITLYYTGSYWRTAIRFFASYI